MVNGNNRSLALGIIISLLFLSMFASVGFVSADTETKVLSIYHKGYSYSNSSATAWGVVGTELSEGNYSAVSSLDDTRDNISSSAGYGYLRGEWNVSKIASDEGFSIGDITQIYIVVEGYGCCASYGANGALYNDDDAVWVSSDTSDVTGVWAHTTAGDANISATITSSIADFISSGGLLKYTARTRVTGGHSLRIDYAGLTITYTITLTAPSLVSPTDGGTGYSITPDFDWNVSTGGTSPYTYEIMVADNLSFTTPDVNVTGLSDSNYSYTTGLTPGTTYYWKVRTKDNGGAYSSWATTQSFTTATFTSPTFTIPTSGTSMTTVTPTFSWSAPTGGDGNYTYELQVSLLNTFATNVVDVTGIATTSYTMTSNLTPDAQYARLRAKDGLNNYSDWTSTVSFTAVAPSSGGSSSSSSSSTQEPYVPPTLTTTDNDDDTTVAPSSGGSVTNIINQYIINPARTIVINPLKQLWDWVVGLFHGSSQETLIEPVADEAESEFNRIVKDMSEDWDAFWSDVEIFIEDIKEVLGC